MGFMKKKWWFRSLMRPKPVFPGKHGKELTVVDFIKYLDGLANAVSNTGRPREDNDYGRLVVSVEKQAKFLVEQYERYELEMTPFFLPWKPMYRVWFGGAASWTYYESYFKAVDAVVQRS